MVRLVEMAQFKGFGITIEVRSSDHGEIAKQTAHAHILDNSGKEKAEIVITPKVPKKSSDIIWYRTDNPPDGLGTAIVKLANSPNAVMKKIGKNELTWQSALNQWLYFHGK